MQESHWIGFENRRERMIERLASMGIGNTVLEAMANVPRHLFVEEALRTRAYDEMSLPLGLGQTISQPYTVAKMTELLLGKHAKNMNKVLEIGTGCGYQTAVLLALGLPEIYWIGPAGEIADREDGTDFGESTAGYITVTPLQIDLTAYNQMGDVAQYWLEMEN